VNAVCITQMCVGYYAVPVTSVKNF